MGEDEQEEEEEEEEPEVCSDASVLSGLGWVWLRSTSSRSSFDAIFVSSWSRQIGEFAQSPNRTKFASGHHDSEGLSFPVKHSGVVAISSNPAFFSRCAKRGWRILSINAVHRFSMSECNRTDQNATRA